MRKMDSRKVLEYSKNVVKELNDSGIMAFVCKNENEDGTFDYGVRLCEDPNSLAQPFVWISRMTDSIEKLPDEVSFAKSLAENLLIKDSPVRSVLAELEEKKYDDIKSLIVPHCINRSIYGTFLENVPHRDYLDFSVVYCYKDKMTIVTITDSLAEKYGVTEQQLYEDGLKNIQCAGPVKISDMFSKDKLKSFAYTKEANDMLEKTSMYIISNIDMLRGSNVMLLPGFLEAVSDKIGGDYYLIPASSDVLVVIPVKDNSVTLSEVKLFNDGFAMNRIENDKKFSNSVFIYSGSKLDIA